MTGEYDDDMTTGWHFDSFINRSTSLLCLTSIAVTPTDRTTSLTPWSVPVKSSSFHLLHHCCFSNRQDDTCLFHDIWNRAFFFLQISKFCHSSLVSNVSLRWTEQEEKKWLQTASYIHRAINQSSMFSQVLTRAARTPARETLAVSFHLYSNQSFIFNSINCVYLCQRLKI